MLISFSTQSPSNTADMQAIKRIALPIQYGISRIEIFQSIIFKTCRSINIPCINLITYHKVIPTSQNQSMTLVGQIKIRNPNLMQISIPSIRKIGIVSKEFFDDEYNRMKIHIVIEHTASDCLWIKSKIIFLLSFLISNEFPFEWRLGKIHLIFEFLHNRISNFIEVKTSSSKLQKPSTMNSHSIELGFNNNTQNAIVPKNAQTPTHIPP